MNDRVVLILLSQSHEETFTGQRSQERHRWGKGCSSQLRKGVSLNRSLLSAAEELTRDIRVSSEAVGEVLGEDESKASFQMPVNVAM